MKMRSVFKKRFIWSHVCYRIVNISSMHEDSLYFYSLNEGRCVGFTFSSMSGSTKMLPIKCDVYVFVSGYGRRGYVCNKANIWINNHPCSHKGTEVSGRYRNVVFWDNWYVLNTLKPCFSPAFAERRLVSAVTRNLFLVYVQNRFASFFLYLSSSSASSCASLLSKYLRLSYDTDAEDALQLITDVWNLKLPKLLIEVTGGAKDFHLHPKLCRLFRKSIVKVAATTGAWILTGGTNTGMPILLKQRRRRCGNDLFTMSMPRRFKSINSRGGTGTKSL